MSENKRIPVAEAKRIADVYSKDEVVILAVEIGTGLTYVATYGKSADNKFNAAIAGEICSKTLGCDLSKKQSFEDFRDGYEPAKHRELQEKYDALLSTLAKRGIIV